MGKKLRITIFLIYIFSLSPVLHSQWIQTNSQFDGSVNCLALIDTNIFAGTRYGVYCSNNQGNDWIPSNAGLLDTWITALAVRDQNIFAGERTGINVSTNKGITWNRINSGLPLVWTDTYPRIMSFGFLDSFVFAGTYGYGIYRTKDNGAIWKAVNSGLADSTPYSYIDQCVFSFASIGKNIYAGTGKGIYVSTDYGENWIKSDSGITHAPTIFVNTLYASDSNLFAGLHNGGIFFSSNGGIHWVPIDTGLSPYAWNIFSFGKDGNNFFASTGDGVFLTTDTGRRWSAVKEGMPDYVGVYSLVISNSYLFAGTAQGSVWRRKLSEMVTSTNMVSDDLPTHYSLAQNYPNPFNPTTIISFNLPIQSYVELLIFDALGRKVSTVVNEVLPMGKHSRQWKATGYSSGMYFYRLQAGSFIETKKLLLLR